MIKCEKCGGEVRIMGLLTISTPGSMYHNFTKRNMRSKDVYFMGAHWETFDFLCQNKKCGYVSNGYGNYVTNLKKENEELKKRLKDYENVPPW